MTTITVKPIVLKDCLLTLGADNYERHISKVEFAPSASSLTWRGLSPSSSFTDTSLATWVANLSFAQDWETPGSLAQLLYNSEGQTIAATFKPRSGAGPSFSALLVVVPGSIGGAVDAFSESTVSLGCSGKPLLVNGTGIPLITLTDLVTGGIAGGNLVAIFGSGFAAATAVKFGPLAATAYRIVSDSLIVAIAPPQAVGAKPITVTNPTGVSAASAYTYA